MIDTQALEPVPSVTVEVVAPAQGKMYQVEIKGPLAKALTEHRDTCGGAEFEVEETHTIEGNWRYTCTRCKLSFTA